MPLATLAPLPTLDALPETRPQTRRTLVWIATALLGGLIVWAGWSPHPTPTASEDAGLRYRAETFAFSHPADWTVSALPGDRAGYRLTPAGQPDGTHITFAYLPGTPATLRDLERWGVGLVERNDAIARHYLRILPSTRVAGLASARVRYTADLDAGQRIEGVWIGTPAPDGRVLTVTLNVHPDAYFNAVYPTYVRLLASVAFAS